MKNAPPEPPLESVLRPIRRWHTACSARWERNPLARLSLNTTNRSWNRLYLPRRGTNRAGIDISCADCAASRMMVTSSSERRVEVMSFITCWITPMN